MKNLNPHLLRLIAAGCIAGCIAVFSSAAFAAGDYVWEEKFKDALAAAEKGDAQSQYAVGEMYEKGKGAVRDSEKAFEWYAKAAEQDDEKAAFKLGYAYLEGDGIKKNYELARKWLQKSANKKYVRAEYYLGVLYEKGRGVEQDYDEAIKWYKQALAGGYGIASEGLQRASSAQQAADREAASRTAAPPPAPRPKPVERPKPQAAPKPLSTKDKILAGGWKKRNTPVEYLPSSDTQCADEDSRIACISTELTRNIGMADITYTTKAILFGFKPNGEFKVSYRNNVSKITVTDEAFAESGGKVPVTLGWQDADHQLTCEFETDRSLACTKNKVRNIMLTR
ncbi:MAG: tetratricopeptide repeat protein [Gammaproteobacteria bacterium]|nr:tetratricopeptide repeat protein [Gammaproteobacteria bacterium]